jgi:hypothetical protein
MHLCFGAACGEIEAKDKNIISNTSASRIVV